MGTSATGTLETRQNSGTDQSSSPATRTYLIRLAAHAPCGWPVFYERTPSCPRTWVVPGRVHAGYHGCFPAKQWLLAHRCLPLPRSCEVPASRSLGKCLHKCCNDAQGSPTWTHPLLAREWKKNSETYHA